jgi:hypothetical protein
LQLLFFFFTLGPGAIFRFFGRFFKNMSPYSLMGRGPYRGLTLAVHRRNSRCPHNHANPCLYVHKPKECLGKSRQTWDQCMYELLSPKKLSKKHCQIKLNVDHYIVFEDYTNFFAKNCRKSQKIVLITSTPGFVLSGSACASQFWYVYMSV